MFMAFLMKAVWIFFFFALIVSTSHVLSYEFKKEGNVENGGNFDSIQIERLKDSDKIVKGKKNAAFGATVKYSVTNYTTGGSLWSGTNYTTDGSLWFHHVSTAQGGEQWIQLSETPDKIYITDPIKQNGYKSSKGEIQFRLLLKNVTVHDSGDYLLNVKYGQKETNLLFPFRFESRTEAEVYLADKKNNIMNTSNLLARQVYKVYCIAEGYPIRNPSLHFCRCKSAPCVDDDDCHLVTKETADPNRISIDTNIQTYQSVIVATYNASDNGTFKCVVDSSSIVKSFEVTVTDPNDNLNETIIIDFKTDPMNTCQQRTPSSCITVPVIVLSALLLLTILVSVTAILCLVIKHRRPSRQDPQHNGIEFMALNRNYNN